MAHATAQSRLTRNGRGSNSVQTIPQMVAKIDRQILTGQGGMHPCRFFAKWLPILYPYDDMSDSRKVMALCRHELSILFPEIKKTTIQKWVWFSEPCAQEDFPSMLPIALFHRDAYLTLLMALGQIWEVRLLPQRVRNGQ